MTVHGRPLQMLEDKAFQEILGLAILRQNESTSIINVRNIKSMISDKAYTIKMKMAKEFQNRLISLKLDSATYQYRSFVGINAQFIQNGEIKIRTLATKEVYESQTGEYLKEILLDVLKDYRIDISQIYSITTDNGRNFKKMTNLLGGSYEVVNIDEEHETEESDEYEESHGLHSNQEHIDTLIDAFIQDERFSMFKPRTMLCAAHTLQLSVKDMINSNGEVQELLRRVREAVKVLRTPTISNILIRANLKKPFLDCTTRWSSTYNMLVRLQLLKEVCVDNADMMSLLNETDWHTINDLIDSLKPVYETTLKLQKEQLTLGDFFIAWLTCKGSLEKLRTEVGQSLLNSMKTREVNLLSTTSMLEALYMDTRLNVVLSDDEARKAQQLLRETLHQIRKVKHDNYSMLVDVEPEYDGEPTASSSHIEVSSSSRTSLAEQILSSTEQQRRLDRRDVSATDILLQEIRQYGRLPSYEDILKFWSNKISSPDLSELALCVLSTPATQVSVERLFSSVRYILSPLRANLSPRSLAEIMIIRSNADLLD